MSEQPWVFRSRSGQWLAGVIVVICLACAVDFALEGGGRMAKYIALPIAVACWALWLFWMPSVRVADSVTLNNPMRRIRVPWAAIQRVDTKWAMTLHTESGAYTAFAAPAPTGSIVRNASRRDAMNLPGSSYVGGLRPGDLPASQSGQVAMVIRERYERRLEAGELFTDDAERAVTVSWRPWPAVITLTLTVAAVVLAFAL